MEGEGREMGTWGGGRGLSGKDGEGRGEEQGTVRGPGKDVRGRGGWLMGREDHTLRGRRGRRWRRDGGGREGRRGRKSRQG